MGTALVTGASSGLGLEFAWQLATGRHHLVLVARNAQRLEEIAAQIRAAANVDVEVLAADLADNSDGGGLARVAERVRQGYPEGKRPIGLLINNAGYSAPQDFVDGDLDVELTMLDVLVRAVLVLSHEAAGAMKERGRGAILNVASVAALTALGTYSAHKAWVRTFTEALAVELRGTGVTATALCPGLVHTDFHRRAGWTSDVFPEVAWLKPEPVVTRALADVRRGAVISTPSVRYGVLSQVARLAPRWMVRGVSGGRAGEHLASKRHDDPTSHDDVAGQNGDANQDSSTSHDAASQDDVTQPN